MGAHSRTVVTKGSDEEGGVGRTLKGLNKQGDRPSNVRWSRKVDSELEWAIALSSAPGHRLTHASLPTLGLPPGHSLIVEANGSVFSTAEGNGDTPRHQELQLISVETQDLRFYLGYGF